MGKDNKYKKIISMVEANDKLDEFYEIMDDYFCELEQYHPQTYTNLMKEIYKLGAQVNIIDENELNKYLKLIHHKDMPKLWSLDETTKVAKEIGIDFDKWRFNPYTFNFVMNMMRADYYHEFKKMFATSPLMKQTILDSPNFYAHLAKAWLDDEDAPKDKAIQYINLLSVDKLEPNKSKKEEVK